MPSPRRLEYSGAVTGGVLYVVATPIGNLEDITLRALRVLKEVAVIACEDTRVTRKLMSAHDIHTPMVAYHAHSSPHVTREIVDRLARGDDVALVTDAGTPAISDPGEDLVRAAIAEGIRVIPIPGPSALTAALSAAGQPAAHVVFLGFLPRSENERREILAPLRDLPYALVLYEASKRASGTLESMRRTLGDRSATIARELTKKFETFERGRLSELEAKLSGGTLGEIVIVVGPPDRGSPPDIARARHEAKRLLEGGMRAADVAKTLAGLHGLTRQEAYRLVLESGEEM